MARRKLTLFLDVENDAQERHVLEALIEALVDRLDRADGNADEEDAGDKEPSLGSLDGITNQNLWAAGGSTLAF